MGNFLHRTSFQHLQSVSPSELPENIANYIEDPDLSAVTGQPSKYWVVTGDVISLMDPAARDAVDAALLEAARDSAMQAEIDQVENVLRAFMLIMVDEINLIRGNFDPVMPARTVQQLRTAIRNRLGS